MRLVVRALLSVLAGTAAAQADEDPRWRFDAEAAYSDLTDGLDPWREGAVRAAYRADEAITVAGAVESSSRFGAFDTYLETRVDARLGPDTWLNALAGATPDADFRPRFAFGLGGAQRLFQAQGFFAAAVATLDLRYAEYIVGDVETANPGLEIYLAKGRAWITARHINILDESGRHRTGYFLRGDIQPMDALTVFGGYADAPDTSEGVTVDTAAWFAGVGADIDTGTSLRLTVGQALRKAGYDRTTVTLSLTLRR